MDPTAIWGIVTGSGGTLVVLLLWIRAITKDRDFWRDAYMAERRLSTNAVEELEDRRGRPPGGGGLTVVS